MKLDTTSKVDLIGQRITISDSKNKEIIGINGKIIMETKNMIIMDTKNGKKSIPKDICKLSNKDGVMPIDSTKLNKKPHERLEILA